MKRYRRFYVFGFLCLAVTSGGQLIIPQLIRLAVDDISSGSFEQGRILMLMAGMIGLAALIAIGRFGWRYFIHGASRRIEADLRERLFDHLVGMPRSFYGTTSSGDLMARATNDMNAIRMASGMALVALFDGIFMSTFILVILFSSRPSLAGIVIIPLPLVTILILVVGGFVGRLFREVQEGFSKLSSQAQEALAGIRVIKAFVKEAYFKRRFREANTNYQNKNMRLVRIWGLFFPLVTFLSGVTILLLLRFGGREVVVGDLSPGDFVATLSYLELLIWPMLGAGFTINMLQRGAASLERIHAILDQKPAITDPEHPVAAPTSMDLEFRSLDFSYSDGEEKVLHDISCSVPAGTMLGILGRVGSGKSTLVKLLTRSEDPPERSIFIGGTDIRHLSLKDLRSLIATVPQDSFLFSMSVHENIAFGGNENNDDAIRRAADVSTITRDLATFPEGWETVIGERGITLSGGQRQRVAIARALATDRDILILDDALSAVDTETEELILGELLKEREGKTSIVVSHRISTLRNANMIIVLDDGRIRQIGTHEELVAQEGFYREIAELQRLEEGQ